MLKIKNEIDLNELEKFGFKHRPKQRNQHEHYAYLAKDKDDIYPRLRCWIWSEDRIIGVNGYKDLNIVFDLIQAGIVEKVEEKNV